MISFDRVKMDWTISIGQIGSVLIFVLTGIGAWYDLKVDVRVHTEQITELKRANDVTKLDSENSLKVIREGQKENRDEIKQEIRDLRNDLVRNKIK